MTLHFVQHGVQDINDSMTLSDCLGFGLNEIEDVDRKGRLWASQTGHCPRRGALEATIITQRPFSAASRFYCEIGNTIEDLIVKAWNERGRLFFAQYKLPKLREFPRLNMGGYVDAIALQDNQIRVLEIKSCGAMPTKPKPEHESQAMVYSAYTGFPATLFYFSREVATWNGKLKTVQFDLSFDVDDLNHYMFNAVMARVCIEKGVMPPMPPLLTTKSRCGMCNFIDFCWDDEQKRMVDGSTLVIPDAGTTARLTKKALAITNEIMKPENVQSRNNGILKHLSRHGTKAAKEFLGGKTWSRVAR